MQTSDLSIKELAAFIGVSTDTIRRVVRRGEIPATRVGTALRFDLHEVRTCMERNAEVKVGTADHRKESCTDARQKHLAALQNLWAADWGPDAEAP